MNTLYSIMILALLFPINLPHVDTAKRYAGTTELTGKNDGPVVEMFLKSVGRKKGDSWCAAYVSYCLTATNIKNPSVRSGLARSFKTKNAIDARKVLAGLQTVPAGYLVGWQNGNTISGHIGIVIEDWKGAKGKTIEGNTSPSDKGSQDNGGGVYYKTRTIQPGSYFRITWFTPVEVEQKQLKGGE